MLKARCKAMLARDVYPDVLAGCYDDDEARDFSPAKVEVIDGGAVEDAVIVSEVTAAQLEAIDMAETEDELRSLAPALAKLTGETKKSARQRYSARLSWIREHAGAAVNGQPAEVGGAA
jgi:hypothetical protein